MARAAPKKTEDGGRETRSQHTGRRPEFGLQDPIRVVAGAHRRHEADRPFLLLDRDGGLNPPLELGLPRGDPPLPRRKSVARGDQDLCTGSDKAARRIDRAGSAVAKADFVEAEFVEHSNANRILEAAFLLTRPYLR